MVISTKNQVEVCNSSHQIVTINNKNIEFVRHHKYLGVIVDSQLSFRQRVDYLIKKINKKNYFMKRVDKDLSSYTKLTIHKTIILPHFMYCTTLLYSVNESLKNDLEIVQNKCMRTILKCDHCTPIRLMLNMLHILSVKDIIYILTMTFIYNIVNDMCPSYMCDLIKFVRDVHSYNTRRKSNMYIDHKKPQNGKNIY